MTSAACPTQDVARRVADVRLVMLVCVCVVVLGSEHGCLKDGLFFQIGLSCIQNRIVQKWIVQNWMKAIKLNLFLIKIQQISFFVLKIAAPCARAGLRIRMRIRMRVHMRIRIRIPTQPRA